MSTPQNNSFETHALSQPVVCMTPYGVQNFNLSKEYQEPQCYYKPFSLPLIWVPPHYQLIDTKQSHNDEKNPQLENKSISETHSLLKESEKALQDAQKEVEKLKQEMVESNKEYVSKTAFLEEKFKKEKEVLTLQILQLKNSLKDTNTQWKEKYQKWLEESEQTRHELYEENQMLKLSVAEKETELLQSQDALLSIRQCLAHLLINLKPTTDIKFSLIPQKDVKRIQSIVNRGQCTDDDSDECKDTSSYSPNDKTPETIFSQSWTTCQTTSTEVDFRRDLAALDADIARLQIQFNVAH